MTPQELARFERDTRKIRWMSFMILLFVFFLGIAVILLTILILNNRL